MLYDKIAVYSIYLKVCGLLMPNLIERTSIKLRLGSRERKQWFLLRHKKTNSDKLLSIMPVSVDMPLPLSRSTAKSLRDISNHLKVKCYIVLIQLKLLIGH